MCENTRYVCRANYTQVMKSKADTHNCLFPEQARHRCNLELKEKAMNSDSAKYKCQTKMWVSSTSNMFKNE